MFCVYIHIPFCYKICDYCDFRVLPAISNLFGEFTALVCKQIKSFEKLHPGLLGTAETLYLGGGTPSALPGDCLRQIFYTLKEVGVRVENLCEVSMEFNPESTSRESLELARDLGVNRVSLGLQTFDADLLRLVGRSHSVKAGLEALRLLTSEEALQVSADLMFNLPNQTVKGFLEDVDRLSDFPLNHLSFYGLNISPRTRLGHRIARGELSVDDSLYEAMYLGGVEILSKKGLLRYEVSNFARPGFESVHNRNYWDRGEYVGFGPGAHSFLDSNRFYAPELYPRWRDYVQADCPRSMLSVDSLDEENEVMELLWLSLRQSHGIFLKDLERRGIRLLEKGYAKWIQRDFLIHENLPNFLQDGACLRLVGRGWIFMDDIVTDLANNYSKLE